VLNGSRKLGARPLYRQVIDEINGRISEGEWVPELPIPSEIELASELGVSQGTVRKALAEMTRDGLLVRHQGKGTFVVGYDDDRILFNFFKLTPDTSEKVFPSSAVISVGISKADNRVAAALNVKESGPVVRIRRVRSLLQHPAIVETIWLSAERFPNLDGRTIPNNLYRLYAMQYGMRIVRAREEIMAVSLAATDAKLLGVPAKTPALQIDRIAFGVDDNPVEHRISLCLTANTHYRVGLF
jgi:GntR family transcriptional regulator